MKRAVLISSLVWLSLVVPGSVWSQALPNLAVGLTVDQRVRVTWPVPTVDFLLQETSTLSGSAAWQSTALSRASNNCAFSITIAPTNATRFFRLAAGAPPAIGLYLGAAQPLLQPRQMGLTDVPDMHTAVLQQPDGSYRLWIAGRFENDAVEGATGLLLTTNFVTYTPGYGPATNALPVLVPSCRGATMSDGCLTNFDATYAGADLVFPATNGTDLLMLYHGETEYYTGSTAPGNGWAVVGLARSSDQGLTWTNRTVIISSSDPKPLTNPPVAGIYGVVEPGAIIAGDYIYAYYSYFPTSPANNPAPPEIQVARAPVSGDAAPGTWTKYYNGSFGSQPGLGGLGSPVVPSVCACTRPAQPWPVFSTYLNAYVLVFIGEEGWFFSTSTNLVDWTPPTQFFTAPNNEFTAGQPTDENVILVTPGNPSQVIGQTGVVLYAHTLAWRNASHELWSRPFTFTRNP